MNLWRARSENGNQLIKVLKNILPISPKKEGNNGQEQRRELSMALDNAPQYHFLFSQTNYLIWQYNQYFEKTKGE